jgi:hypothetical protein
VVSRSQHGRRVGADGRALDFFVAVIMTVTALRLLLA